MTEETKLLRAAVEASIKADRLDPRGEHFADAEPYAQYAKAKEAADKAWELYSGLAALSSMF